MKTLVFGGSTFVGRRTVLDLARRSHDVAILNRGVTQVDLPDGIERIVADRTDNDQMKKALSRRSFDAVFDVSGFVMVAGGSDIPFLFDLLDGNVGHYVYCSSITAYEPSGIFPWPETNKLTDAPSNTYGGFKAYVEQLLFDRNRATGFPATTVRPAAIYGPDNNIYDMEAPLFMRLARGLPILVPHEGLVTCSYGHVDDLCRFMGDIAGKDEAKGEAFNLSDTAVTVNHYVNTLAEIAGKEPDIVYVPKEKLSTYTRPVFGHLFGVAHHCELSMAKAQEMFGHENEYDFRKGHEHTFEWFIEKGWAEIEETLRDPLWQTSYDFELEAKAAAEIRGS
ncbi:MAG TPA: NAD-dependent epimerase/dehydratase family protein [Dehalococcoidia bacterium]|nr:NAD-dependent epimerase/dehydratase family protein [Dehalococcoidia bacterium]